MTNITHFTDLNDAFEEAYYIAKKENHIVAIIDCKKYLGVCSATHAEKHGHKILEKIRPKSAGTRWFKNVEHTEPAPKFAYAPRNYAAA